MKLFYMNFKIVRNLLDFFFFVAEFPYTIFQHLGACFTNLLNNKNILNMNIEDNCTDTLTKLIKEKDISLVWKVSIFIIPYSIYCNCDLVLVFLHIIFNIKFIIYDMISQKCLKTIQFQSNISILANKSQSIVWNYFQNKKIYKYELRKGS